MAPPTRQESEELAKAWADLTAGDPWAPAAPSLDVTGESGHLVSHLAVGDVALAAIGTALRAASAFGQQRGAPESGVTVDRSHVAAAVRSERHFRIAGQPGRAPFAPLSHFWRTADGWVRTHGNYPWHRRALLTALGLTSFLTGPDDDASVEAVAGAVAEQKAAEIEDRVFAMGGVAAALRSPEGWAAHPQGQTLAGEPLIDHQILGSALPRQRESAPLPMTGIRVLDLTRVMAGPVCTRYLGALGADVLRIDPPGRPDLNPGFAADTLLGKRSTFLDLASPGDQAVLHELLDGADVVVHGYRPGALDRFGLGSADLAARHAGLVVVHFDAWGHAGPWLGRRGFDSIVQAASGIAMLESVDGSTPGVMPCQLLDHGTGYLAAAAAVDGLRRQSLVGGTVIRSLSLARTAAWLTGTRTGSASPQHEPSGPTEPSGPSDRTGPLTSQAWTAEFDSPAGSIVAVAPPGGLDGRPLEWARPPAAYGADPPGWAPR